MDDDYNYGAYPPPTAHSPTGPHQQQSQEDGSEMQPMAPRRNSAAGLSNASPTLSNGVIGNGSLDKKNHSSSAHDDDVSKPYQQGRSVTFAASPNNIYIDPATPQGSINKNTTPYTQVPPPYGNSNAHQQQQHPFIALDRNEDEGDPDKAPNFCKSFMNYFCSSPPLLLSDKAIEELVDQVLLEARQESKEVDQLLYLPSVAELAEAQQARVDAGLEQGPDNLPKPMGDRSCCRVWYTPIGSCFWLLDGFTVPQFLILLMALCNIAVDAVGLALAGNEMVNYFVIVRTTCISIALFLTIVSIYFIFRFRGGRTDDLDGRDKKDRIHRRRSRLSFARLAANGAVSPAVESMLVLILAACFDCAMLQLSNNGNTVVKVGVAALSLRLASMLLHFIDFIVRPKECVWRDPQFLYRAIRTLTPGADQMERIRAEIIADFKKRYGDRRPLSYQEAREAVIKRLAYRVSEYMAGTAALRDSRKRKPMYDAMGNIVCDKRLAQQLREQNGGKGQQNDNGNGGNDDQHVPSRYSRSTHYPDVIGVNGAAPPPTTPGGLYKPTAYISPSYPDPFRSAGGAFGRNTVGGGIGNNGMASPATPSCYFPTPRAAEYPTVTIGPNGYPVLAAAEGDEDGSGKKRRPRGGLSATAFNRIMVDPSLADRFRKTMAQMAKHYILVLLLIIAVLFAFTFGNAVYELWRIMGVQPPLFWKEHNDYWLDRDYVKQTSFPAREATGLKVHMVVVGGLRDDYTSPFGSALGEYVNSAAFKPDSLKFSARAQLPTFSVPNWMSLLSGSTPEDSGVIGDYVNTFTRFDNVFAIAQAYDVHAGVTGSPDWDTLFKPFLPVLDGDGTVDTYSTFSGMPVTDRQSGKNSDYIRGLAAVAAAERSNVNDPFGPTNDVRHLYQFFVTHFSDVDVQASEHGVDTEWNEEDSYKTAIKDKTELIKNIVSAIDSDTVLIITSDHGHVMRGGHGGEDDVLRDIPLIFYKKGSNANTFASSGANFPSDQLPKSDYKNKYSNLDLSATITALLGLPSPRQSLGVFVEEALNAFLPSNATMRLRFYHDLLMAKVNLVREYESLLDSTFFNYMIPSVLGGEDINKMLDYAATFDSNTNPTLAPLDLSQSEYSALVRGALEDYWTLRDRRYVIVIVRNLFLSFFFILPLMIVVWLFFLRSPFIRLGALVDRRHPAVGANWAALTLAFLTLFFFAGFSMGSYFVYYYGILSLKEWDATVFHRPFMYLHYEVVTTILPIVWFAACTKTVLFRFIRWSTIDAMGVVSGRTCGRLFWFLTELPKDFLTLLFATWRYKAHNYQQVLLYTHYLAFLTVMLSILLLFMIFPFGFAVPCVLSVEHVHPILIAYRFRMMTTLFFLSTLQVGVFLMVLFRPKFPGAESRTSTARRANVAASPNANILMWDQVWDLCTLRSDDYLMERTQHDSTVSDWEAYKEHVVAKRSAYELRSLNAATQQALAEASTPLAELLVSRTVLKVIMALCSRDRIRAVKLAKEAEAALVLTGNIEQVIPLRICLGLPIGDLSSSGMAGGPPSPAAHHYHQQPKYTDDESDYVPAADHNPHDYYYGMYPRGGGDARHQDIDFSNLDDAANLREAQLAAEMEAAYVAKLKRKQRERDEANGTAYIDMTPRAKETNADDWENSLEANMMRKRAAKEKRQQHYSNSPMNVSMGEDSDAAALAAEMDRAYQAKMLGKRQKKDDQRDQLLSLRANNAEAVAVPTSPSARSMGEESEGAHLAAEMDRDYERKMLAKRQKKAGASNNNREALRPPPLSPSGRSAGEESAGADLAEEMERAYEDKIMRKKLKQQAQLDALEAIRSPSAVSVGEGDADAELAAEMERQYAAKMARKQRKDTNAPVTSPDQRSLGDDSEGAQSVTAEMERRHEERMLRKGGGVGGGGIGKMGAPLPSPSQRSAGGDSTTSAAAELERQYEERMLRKRRQQQLSSPSNSDAAGGSEGAASAAEIMAHEDEDKMIRKMIQQRNAARRAKAGNSNAGAGSDDDDGGQQQQLGASTTSSAGMAGAIDRKFEARQSRRQMQMEAGLSGTMRSETSEVSDGIQLDHSYSNVRGGRMFGQKRDEKSSDAGDNPPPAAKGSANYSASLNSLEQKGNEAELDKFKALKASLAAGRSSSQPQQQQEGSNKQRKKSSRYAFAYHNDNHEHYVDEQYKPGHK